jgi:hydroxymethylpyrimidine pyrophosphatase-like HAD family hydrolase
LAVATAHPLVKKAAKGIIPSYTEDGVLQEWKKLLERAV